MKLLVLLAVLAFVAACDAAQSEGGVRQSILERLKVAAAVPAICTDYIYKQEFRPDFSQCLNEASVPGQGDVDCAAADMQNYDSCAGNAACSWWHLSGKDKCMANPCFRIGLCTIQNTGGRCVWYTKAANKALRGINAPGCYKSPCSNPLDNSKKGCAAKSNDYFQCTWCPKYKGQAYGCMNAEDSSIAQCWNVNGAGSTKGCNNCEGNMGKTCASDKCKQNCCQSPLCMCELDPFRSGTDAGNDILSSDA